MVDCKKGLVSWNSSQACSLILDMQQTDEQVKLLKYQRRLEEELNHQYLDKTLHQTIYQLITENNHKLAEQLRKEFKVPDRRSAGVPD